MKKFINSFYAEVTENMQPWFKKWCGVPLTIIGLLVFVCILPFAIIGIALGVIAVITMGNFFGEIKSMFFKN